MSDPEIFVNAVEKGTPKAIVILFGWLGAQPRHLEKYAKLYQDMNCSTIHLVADVLVRRFVSGCFVIFGKLLFVVIFFLPSVYLTLFCPCTRMPPFFEIHE